MKIFQIPIKVKQMMAKARCVFQERTEKVVTQNQFCDFYFNIRGKLSVMRCYTWFFSMAWNRF